MGGWGSYSPWGLLVCNDARNPESKYSERSLLTLSDTISTAKFRQASENRPELNWGLLSNEEIYPFILWHEIGHHCANFSPIDITAVPDADVRGLLLARSTYVNEALADRYAWEKIRPGEPMPLTERGRTRREELEESIAFLGRHVTLSKGSRKPLCPGLYRDVPEYMMATRERAAYLGPKVDKALLRKRISYHRAHVAMGRPPLYLTGVESRAY
jgi:hypothetical protein